MIRKPPRGRTPASMGKPLLRLIRLEIKKILPLSHRLILLAVMLLLFFCPLLLRSSELGVYESIESRKAMFSAHESPITEAYLQDALALYRSLPFDIFDQGLIYYESTEDTETARQYLSDLHRQLEAYGLPSFSYMGYQPQENEAPILVPEQEGLYTYADLDGFRLYFSLLDGIGSLVSLLLPSYLLSSLLNMEVASGMRRVILTVAGSERSQILSKWISAALISMAAAVAVPLCLALGTQIACGLPNAHLSALHIRPDAPQMSIAAYLGLRMLLILLGSLCTAALAAGFSGILSQPVGAMVAVIAIFLLPLLPLPPEAPAWLVSAQKYGPIGFFSGDAIHLLSPSSTLLFLVLWCAASLGIAVLGRVRFRTMRIPEEYFKA